MQRSSASAFPTITFEKALQREMEYRKRLERTHRHLLIALNGAPEWQKEVGTESISDGFKRKLAPESTVPQQQSSFSCSAVQTQPANCAHIGGKKHKAKKLEILGNRNTGRPGSQCSGNRNPVQNSHVVSGSRNSEPTGSSVIVSASCDLPSESRVNETGESGCTAPPMSSLDFTAI
ncbi:hypothetical protein BAE44_0004983 [Dichanthelium oligosanthes]|uniref:Uncharacterized protein n=1 Tax=Dichanthelium oligosanthes TaxID=888268 RepID=A0A1E5W9T7_9POAL|nr:hypothetical protein BAE44_0004983 [Dichanthelium oligosanthes]